METVLRVIFVYFFVWACFRVVGKRELSQMAPFELVMLLFVPQFFSRALTRQDYSMTNAVTAATTLFSLVLLTSIANFRFSGFRRVMESNPSVLVKRGRILSEALGHERIAPSEIFSAMHKAGVERIEDVAWAILEGDGKIAIIRVDADDVHRGSSEGGTGARRT
ncbi:MAG TPA: YetF domain-containing protein [Gemmatimonadaceae bacterium]|nr:YetF domain-containing protein [Gemmatimonadaceae bacterium]